MFAVTDKKIHAMLVVAGIKKGSGDIKEYERGKKVFAERIWGDKDGLSNDVQRIIADYVGI